MFNKLKNAYLTIRLQHCTKNLLVFLPVMASHNFEYYFLKISFLCFLCMTAITFGTYFFNDIVDINHDRKHPLKKYRPIAAGELKIFEGSVIGIFLILMFYFDCTGSPSVSIQFNPNPNHFNSSRFRNQSN